MLTNDAICCQMLAKVEVEGLVECYQMLTNINKCYKQAEAEVVPSSSSVKFMFLKFS